MHKHTGLCDDGIVAHRDGMLVLVAMDQVRFSITLVALWLMVMSTPLCFLYVQVMC